MGRCYTFIEKIFSILLAILLVGCDSDGAFNAFSHSNLASIEITSEQDSPTLEPLTLVAGTEQSFFATGFYLDGSDSNISSDVIWHIEDPDIAKFNNGVLKAVTTGQTVITARHNEVISNTIIVNVSEAVITELTIDSTSIALPLGHTKQLEITAIYSDDSHRVVDNSMLTWHINDSQVAAISESGLLTTLDRGQTSIAATYSESQLTRWLSRLMPPS